MVFYQSGFSRLFNFVIRYIVEIALLLRKNRNFDICTDRSLSDLEYVDDVTLLSEDLGKFQDCLALNNTGVAFRTFKV